MWSGHALSLLDHNDILSIHYENLRQTSWWIYGLRMKQDEENC